MAELRGVLHVHSRASYDGVHSLEELAAFALGRGYDFVGMSEHSDTLDAGIVARYAQECRDLSARSGCLLIPGIEFSCEQNLHLIGLGASVWCASKDPVELCAFLRQQGGVSIVAHPCRYRYQVSEALLEVVDGIEVWNAGYDGRFAPDPLSMELFRRCRERRAEPPVHAFAGLDLHRISPNRGAEILVPKIERRPEAILEALRRGRFTMVRTWMSLRPDGRDSLAMRLAASALHRLYITARRWRGRLCPE